MTKSEATQAMKEGKKVRHRHFEPHEWITIIDDRIWTEDGYSYSYDEFWCVRTGRGWTKDWEIFESETAPPMSGEQKTAEETPQSFIGLLHTHSINTEFVAAADKMYVTSAPLAYFEVVCKMYADQQNAALKAALAELIAAGYCNCIDLKLLDKTSKLLDKHPQSESDGDKNL